MSYDPLISSNAGDLQLHGTLDLNSNTVIGGQISIDSNTGISSFGVADLPNPKQVATGITVSNGSAQTIYTVPANRKAIWFQGAIYNATGGTLTAFPQVVHNGIARQVQISQNIGAGINNILMQSMIVLNAGDQIQWTTNGSGMNIHNEVVEFDNSAAINGVIVNTLSAGNNTVYTCPAGKTARIGYTGAGLQAQGALEIINFSGSTRTYHVNLVPNGGSATSSNIITAAQSYNNGTGLSSQTIIGTLQAGDFVSINSDSAASGQLVWFNVLEFAETITQLVPAGSDTQVQFNKAGVLSASSSLTYNDSSKTLTLDGGALNEGTFVLTSSNGGVGIEFGAGSAYGQLTCDLSGNITLYSNTSPSGSVNLETNDVSGAHDWFFNPDGGLVLPSLATEPLSPSVGEVIYQSTANKLEVWNGTSWVSGGGGGSPNFQYSNDSTSYHISSNDTYTAVTQPLTITASSATAAIKVNLVIGVDAGSFSSGGNIFISVFRDGTNIGFYTGGGIHNNIQYTIGTLWQFSGGSGVFQMVAEAIDIPGDTSPHVYQFYAAIDYISGSPTVSFNQNNVNSPDGSFFLAQEISAAGGGGGGSQVIPRTSFISYSTNTAEISTSSTSFVTTPLTLTNTLQKSTNSWRIRFNSATGANKLSTGQETLYVTVYRDGSPMFSESLATLSLAPSAGSGNNLDSLRWPVSGYWEDAPGDTAAHVYTVMIRVDIGHVMYFLANPVPISSPESSMATFSLEEILS